MRYVLGAGGGGDTVCLDVMPDQLHGIVITGATRSGALLPSSLVLSATEAQDPDTLRVWLVRPDWTDPSILKAKLVFLEQRLPSTDPTLLLRQEVDDRVAAFHRDTLLSGLPHVDHLIAGDGSASILAELAAAEIDRRLDLLDRAGAQDWTDYTWLRNHRRAELAPLPQILIQADQYPTLLASEGAAQIAGALDRLCAAGRCAGVALQLCSTALTFETGRTGRSLLSSMSYAIVMGDVDHETLRILGRSDIEAAARPGRAVLHYRGNLTMFTPTLTM